MEAADGVGEPEPGQLGLSLGVQLGRLGLTSFAQQALVERSHVSSDARHMAGRQGPRCEGGASTR